MTKIDDLVLAIQREIWSHSWATFAVEVEPGGPKVTVPGCPLCQEQRRAMQLQWCREEWRRRRR